MRILAIETSCDETAIAIAEFFGFRKNTRIKILSNIVSSQAKLHAKFGGVVPNLAKREHQKNLVPILLRALKESRLYSSSEARRSREADIKKKKSSRQARTIKNIERMLERDPDLFARIRDYLFLLKPPKIDAIAVTYGPGLAPALWVGVNFAKALAYLWNKPIIPVNHMEGHLCSALLQPEQRNSKLKTLNFKQIPNLKSQTSNDLEFRILNLEFPAIALLVSGGHTELVLMHGYGKYKIIGETLDDAAGEAFDKVARLLGLPYPGGPAIELEAEKNFQFPISNFQINPQPQTNSKFKIKLPRPMLNSQDYNFSFSGLKTAVLYLIEDLKNHSTSLGARKYPLAKIRQPIAYEFQNAVVDVLVVKTIRAAKEFKAKTILLGGGVSANKLLRRTLTNRLQNELSEAGCWLPEAVLAGDNALMIALVAYFSKNKKTKNWQKISARANLRIDD